MSDSVFFTKITHGIHLVLHQSNQGRYNDRSTFHHNRRQLVTEGLPSAGGHQHKGVIPGQHIFNDCFLIPFKGIKTKMSL